MKRPCGMLRSPALGSFHPRLSPGDKKNDPGSTRKGTTGICSPQNKSRSLLLSSADVLADKRVRRAKLPPRSLMEGQMHPAGDDRSDSSAEEITMPKKKSSSSRGESSTRSGSGRRSPSGGGGGKGGGTSRQKAKGGSQRGSGTRKGSNSKVSSNRSRKSSGPGGK